MAGKFDAMPHVSAEKLYQVEHPQGAAAPPGPRRMLPAPRADLRREVVCGPCFGGPGRDRLHPACQSACWEEDSGDHAQVRLDVVVPAGGFVVAVGKEARSRLFGRVSVWAAAYDSIVLRPLS